MNRTKVIFSLLILILTSFVLKAQDQIELLSAESLESGLKNGEKYNRILGNVQLKQKDTFLYCDSAHHYKDRNYVDIFSNVRVVQNALTITSNTATYDGNNKIASFKGGVNLRDDKMTLTTPSLVYNMNTNIGRYTEGGTILETDNTLTSRFGNYNANTKILSFRGNVHLIGKEADIKSDTLQYNTINKIVYFVAPTRIVNQEQNLLATGGFHNTVTGESQFLEAQAETPDYTIAGKVLRHNKAKEYLYATGNVKMTSKDQKYKVIITGQVVQHWQGLGKSKVSGSPVMRSLVSGDTLFISADTLVSMDFKDPKKKDFLYAYYDVRVG
jgi:lipopolysaccharide assembly outer membrane protein LptD (OstA)